MSRSNVSESRDRVVQQRRERVGLHAVGQERGLELLGGRLRIDAGPEREEVDGRIDPVTERGGERALRGRDAGHLERRRVREDADHLEPHVAARLGIADVDGHGREALVLEVEAAQLEVRRRTEVEVAAALDDERVDHREPGVVVHAPATPRHPTRTPSPAPRDRRWCA